MVGFFLGVILSLDPMKGKGFMTSHFGPLIYRLGAGRGAVDYDRKMKPEGLDPYL